MPSNPLFLRHQAPAHFYGRMNLKRGLVPFSHGARMANRQLGLGMGLTPTPPTAVSADEDADFCLKAAKRLFDSATGDLNSAGEWLNKAKSKCPYGQWLAKLEKWEIAPRTAQVAMKNHRDINEFVKSAESAHLKGRKAGDDSAQERKENPLPFRCDDLAAKAQRIAGTICKTKDVKAAKAEQAVRDIASAAGVLKNLAQAPPKPYVKPYAKKCDKCQEEGTMAQTKNYKFVFLSQATGFGNFEIKDGIANYLGFKPIHWEGARMLHHKTCKGPRNE